MFVRRYDVRSLHCMTSSSLWFDSPEVPAILLFLSFPWSIYRRITRTSKMAQTPVSGLKDGASVEEIAVPTEHSIGT